MMRPLGELVDLGRGVAAGTLLAGAELLSMAADVLDPPEAWTPAGYTSPTTGERS